MNSHLDAEDDPDVPVIVDDDGGKSLPDLPKPSLIKHSNFNNAVQALIDVSICKEEEEGGPAMNEAAVPSTVVVERAAGPINEWAENDVLLTSAFAHLLLLGKGRREVGTRLSCDNSLCTTTGDSRIHSSLLLL